MSDLPIIREIFAEALESPPLQREALLAGLAPAVRAEVLSLLAAHDSAGEFLRGAPSEHLLPGTQVGPYQIVEVIGAGGMGVVYRARRSDGEFDRDVAIKFVGGRLVAHEAERRFIAERRILAMLDHPNVVTMLGGGIWQGQRYLVMEFVDGAPAPQYCQRQNLSVAQRLRLFQDICAAIQYAHQNLIIHRDIKPSNILVTEAGQAKVLDFGVARLLDDEGVTADTTLLRPITLAYASPEQLRGERVSLASDIYSLGLLLHELLTGQNPQAGVTEGELRARMEHEPPVPSGTDKSMPADLDAIVRKCLSRDSAGRYRSAADLADDVGRFLERRPILARPPSRLYQALRFAERNRALTVVMAALVLAVILGSGVALWQAHRAEQQRQIAERRFREARRLVYTVIHEIQPKMAAINGTVALRVQLIEKTLVYLEALRQDAGDSPALMRELIGGYVELASVAGSMAQANVGDPKRAGQMLDRARELADTLQRAAVPDADTLRSLSRLYRAAAQHEVIYGKPAAAVESAQRALQMADRLLALAPRDESAQQELALSEAKLGDVIGGKAAIPHFERAAGIWRGALQKGTGAKGLRNQLAVMMRNLSSAWLNAGDPEKALDCALEATQLDEPALRENPKSPEAQLAAAFDFGAAGAAYTQLAKHAPALESWRRSLELRRQVLAANPDDRRAADRIGFAAHEVARLESLLGDRPAARRDYQQAIEIYTRLSQTAPLPKQSQFKFASSLYGLGMVEREAGDRHRSCLSLRQAIAAVKVYEQGIAVSSSTAAIISRWREAASGCGL